ncbi:MAG: M23 family metallopeptidase [Candidatus Pacearchaeota archaeon]|nr:M23 family metallopeptidase [Candidatus Pacearchaeota archaeon]
MKHMPYWTLAPLAALFALNCATGTVAVRPHNESAVPRKQLLSDYLTGVDFSSKNLHSLLNANLPKGLENVILRCPLNEGAFTIGDKFGMRMHPIKHERIEHTGVDLKASEGTNVYAAYGGTIISVGRNGNYGRRIVIEHGGFLTTYNHLKSYNKMHPSQEVEIGQIIGKIGSSGLSTGPHLHFEIVDETGNFRDPLAYITERHTEIAYR